MYLGDNMGIDAAISGGGFLAGKKLDGARGTPLSALKPKVISKVDLADFKQAGGSLASINRSIGINRETLRPGETQANISDEELQKLVNIFQKRSDEISSRRLAPGVTQTRLIGR